MKKRVKIIAAVVICAAIVSTACYIELGTKNKKAEKPVISTIHKIKKSSLERTRYDMNLTLNDENKTITGNEVVKLKNNYGVDLKELVFHLYADSYNSKDTMPDVGKKRFAVTQEELGDININSVKTSEGVKKYTQDKEVLKITLKRPLKKDEEAEVNIAFTLKIPEGKQRLGYFQNVISVTNWYPILSIYDKESGKFDENPFCPVGESNYSESSDYRVNIAVPKGMILATTGVKTSEDKSGALDKYSFEAKDNRDFDMFMSKDYKVVTSEIDGIKVNSYYFDYESSAKRMLNLACDTIKFFDEKIGKYPFSEYNIAETYLDGGDMEYPTVTQMGNYNKLNENCTDRDLSQFDMAIIHETLHQWWYSTVGNNEFKESFLDESLASYFTSYFMSAKFGKDTLFGISDFEISDDNTLQKNISQDEPLNRAVDKYSSLEQYETAIYTDAPKVIERLRQKVGDEKFIDIFKEYYKNYKFKIGTLKDFYKVVEEQCGKDTGEWLKGELTGNNAK
ncbi:M1 family metallopeptidase [Clostridium neuense]|uniref:M1 family metallopeptidase n=1 Tax=Clostridium neuense TaxID=1728934 RepID=A0ABW8TKG7_9CLOT